MVGLTLNCEGGLSRIFVCIEIPAAQKRALSDWLAFAHRLTSRVRWVMPEALHITLKFCGEKPQTIVDSITSLLEGKLHSQAISLSLCGVEGFPSLSRSHVIWTAVKGETEKLKKLQKEVEDRIVLAGVARDKNPYVPHLTLGRVSPPAALSPSVMEAIAKNPPCNLTWQAYEIALMKSELLPSGPRYTRIGLFKLQ